MRGENVLQTLQRYVTLAQQVEEANERQREFQERILAQWTRMEGQLSDLRERVAKLEAQREADHSQLQAEVSRFKLEVERAELRLSRLLPEPPGNP